MHPTSWWEDDMRNFQPRRCPDGMICSPGHPFPSVHLVHGLLVPDFRLCWERYRGLEPSRECRSWKISPFLSVPRSLPFT